MPQGWGGPSPPDLQDHCPGALCPPPVPGFPWGPREGSDLAVTQADGPRTASPVPHPLEGAALGQAPPVPLWDPARHCEACQAEGATGGRTEARRGLLRVCEACSVLGPHPAAPSPYRGRLRGAWEWAAPLQHRLCGHLRRDTGGVRAGTGHKGSYRSRPGLGAGCHSGHPSKASREWTWGRTGTGDACRLGSRALAT